MNNSKNFNKRYLKKLPIGLIILLILFAAGIFLFAFITYEVIYEKKDAFDNAIFTFLSSSVISPGLTIFMKDVTFFGSATFLEIAYAALLLIYIIARNWKRVFEIICIGLGGYLVNYFMKLSFHRIRPPNPLIDPLSNFSFPSGHATSAFIFYGLVAYLIWKTKLPRAFRYMIGGLLILFSLLIGFSRVYLRVHFPSDVIAGICIGFAWLFILCLLFERLKKKSHTEIEAKGIVPGTTEDQK